VSDAFFATVSEALRTSFDERKVEARRAHREWHRNDGWCPAPSVPTHPEAKIQKMVAPLVGHFPKSACAAEQKLSSLSCFRTAGVCVCVGGKIPRKSNPIL